MAQRIDSETNVLTTNEIFTERFQKIGKECNKNDSKIPEEEPFNYFLKHATRVALSRDVSSRR